MMEGMVREAIKAAMKKQKVSGYELAKRAKVPKSVVYLFLNGRQENSTQGKQGPTENMRLAHVDAMLKALGLTVAPALLTTPAKPKRPKKGM